MSTVVDTKHVGLMQTCRSRYRRLFQKPLVGAPTMQAIEPACQKVAVLGARHRSLPGDESALAYAARQQRYATLERLIASTGYPIAALWRARV